MTALLESAPGAADLRASLHLGATYRARRLYFIRRQVIVGWRMKIYGIAAHGDAASAALVAATVERAAEVLPQPPTGEERSGIGVAIAHDAATVGIALINWWASANELHHRVFVAPREDLAAMMRLSQPGAGCVWELVILDFERRAWRDDVLANPAGPDVEAYLSRELDVTY
jgi:hypothetical protein